MNETEYFVLEAAVEFIILHVQLVDAFAKLREQRREAAFTIELPVVLPSGLGQSLAKALTAKGWHEVHVERGTIRLARDVPNEPRIRRPQKLSA